MEKNKLAIILILLLIPTYAYADPQVFDWTKTNKSLHETISRGSLFTDNVFFAIQGVSKISKPQLEAIGNITSTQQAETKGGYVSWSGGGDGTSWSDRKNWSSAKIPASRDRIFIGPNYHIALDMRFTLIGILHIAKGASLTLSDNLSNLGYITNEGIITIKESRVLSNQLVGSIDNFGEIDNYGTITNGLGNTIDNRGHIINSLGGIITNSGIISNCGGTIDSQGKMSGNQISSGKCNYPPVVNAGPDLSISFPTNSAMLSGSVKDDGLPTNGKLTTTWLKLSGPGDVVFADQSSAKTRVTFGMGGIYILRIIADDSQLQSYDDVTITVKDTAPPDTIITSGPSGVVNSPSAQFTFNSTKPGSEFRCSLDNETFSSCTSPAIFTGLIDGTHKFQVKAVDVFGNIDPTSASQIWTVNTTGPVVTISSGPPGDAITGSSVSFTFTASKPQSNFECKLDNASFSSCTSPVKFQGLKVGYHVLQIHAFDELSNQGPTITTRWGVDMPPTLSLPKNQTIGAQDAQGTTFSYDSTANDLLDGSLTPLCTPPSGSKFPIGQTVIKCFVKDKGGFTATGSFVLSVIDFQMPTMSKISDIIAEADNLLGTTVKFNIPTAMDPIDGPLSVKCNPDSGSKFPLGSSTVTCSAKDRAGNTVHTTFFVTVQDTSPPTVVGIPDRKPDANVFYNQPVRITWIGTDVGSGILSCDPSTTYFGPDSKSITLTGHCLDKAGNLGTAKFTISYDSTAPVLVVPSNFTVTAKGTVGTVVVYSFSATDKLSTPKISCSPPSGSIFQIGTTTVTCTATDFASNSVTKKFNVTVLRSP